MRHRGTAAALASGLAWGVACWVDSFGLLTFAGAALLAYAVRQGRAAVVVTPLVTYAIALLWVLTAWRDGIGGSPWLPYALLVGVQALPAVLAIAATRATEPRLGPLAAGAAWAVAHLLSPWVQVLPAMPALFVADSSAWLWPAAVGGPVLLGALVMGWGAWVIRDARALLALLLWFGVGIALQQVPESGRLLRVGVVQPDISALDGRVPSNKSVIADRIVRLAALDADLVATPEGAWPYDATGPSRRRDLQKRFDGLPPVLLGATLGDRPHHNSMLAVDGTVLGRTDKLVLVPIWERSVFGFGTDRYQPGQTGVLEIAGTSVGVLICYEDLFPGRIHEAQRGADLIVAASNDSWNGPGAGSAMHLRAARLAAVTSGLWVVRPTYNGRSAVFDAWGRTLWQAPYVDGPIQETTGRSAVVTVRARKSWRRGALVGMAVGVLALGLLLWRR